MSKAAMNLQDSFLNQVRRENSEVRVLLVNGTLLRGTVKGFDNFTLILNNRNGQHMIYKHAIAQIVTHRPHNRAEDFVAGEAPDASAESLTEHEKHEAPETKLAASEHHGGESHGRHKPRKEGFNKLDLSQVKLGESEKR